MSLVQVARVVVLSISLLFSGYMHGKEIRYDFWPVAAFVVIINAILLLGGFWETAS